MSDSNPYIIAIGASAGGLEAIAAFFDYTPADAVSYVLIQHLSANYKSQMAQILARHSKLQVLDATDHMEIKSNKVYLIPSSKFMTIKNNTLVLTDKTEHLPPYLTIDHFFSSLAAERGEKAIGILLSGSGHDGSRGIEAIKKAGGLVIIQDPDTAGFKEMPLAAIATGYSDMVLSPQAMPQVIEEYIKDGRIESLTNHLDDAISEPELAGIIELIKGNLPLDFTDYKRPTILRRIKRRMVQNNFTQAIDYFRHLQEYPNEVEILANDFLIGVTSFFRDPEAFKIIQEKVLPQLIDPKAKADILKIWVAGCSTGEEAYSLAILVKEYVDKTNKELEIKIFATDINKAALDIAAKGIYSDKAEKTISPERLQHFFTKNGTNYQINHEIRRMLIFAQHDLSKNPPYCNIDLMSCRNVLIYLNPTLQKKVFSLLHFGLKNQGYLFLGPSEHAVIVQKDFVEISNKWNILKCNKNGQSARFDTFLSPVIEGLKTTTMEVSKKTATPTTKLAAGDAINQAMWEEAGFSGICTDESLQVVQSFGNPAPYLKNEILNFDLNDLLPDHVALTIKAAAHKAFASNQKITLEGLRFEGMDGKETHTVNVILRPVLKTGSADKLLLVLFIDSNSADTDNNSVKIGDIEQLTKEHVISLEREVAELRQNLHVCYEKIESSNENLQSFNEELLSANEEMQSANEELQSVNEELQSVNKEQQSTNGKLTELNDDLNNYFRSNVNGQLFVDRDLLIKNYSPAAVKHINIQERDIGRPLSNLTTNIKLETLMEDIKTVMQDEQTILREAESSDGRLYQVMVMPYIRKSNQQSDGAIISFYDITDLKRLLRELGNSNNVLLKINGDLNNFVFSASHDLNAPIFNIEMLLSILNKKIDMGDPDVLSISEMIQKAVNSFKAVTNELGKVGKIEADMQDENTTEPFETIFQEVTDSISEKIKTTNTRISTDFREKTIRFPKKNLRSIFLNLITNAIKFVPPERHPDILIRTQQVDDYTLLTVKDNGLGITKDRQNFVFNLYHRLHEDIEGQGIGLYLIKKIIDASGGKIEVETELGTGSTFKVFFKQLPAETPVPVSTV